jgi:hypothetical protein
MKDRQILSFFNLSIKEYMISSENYDDCDMDFSNYSCYGFMPVPSACTNKKIKSQIEATFSSNKGIEPFPHERYFYEVEGEIAPQFLERMRAIDDKLREIGLYTQALTLEEIHQLSTMNFDTLEDYVFVILEYRYLCGVFDFKNGFATYNLDRNIFEWMKEKFGDNCPSINYFTFKRKIYYAAENGDDLKELDYVYSYSVVVQFEEEGRSNKYITADFEANSRYYQEDLWTWFLNEGMEFMQYDVDRDDTRKFFYRHINGTTQGHILSVFEKDYKKLQTFLAALEEKSLN